MIATSQSEDIKPDFLGSKFEMEYFVLSLVCSILLIISVVLPYISVGYGMERAFFQMLTVLSPFFIIGGITVSRWLRAKPDWIVLIALIPFFMSTTGTMYQLFGVPASMVLNSTGTEYQDWYVHDQDSYAAKWLERYRDEVVMLNAGVWPGQRVLQSQGKIPMPQIRDYFVSQYQKSERTDGYLYLRYIDITVNRIVTEYPDIFAGRNKIYATNGSEIYK